MKVIPTVVSLALIGRVRNADHAVSLGVFRMRVTTVWPSSAGAQPPARPPRTFRLKAGGGGGAILREMIAEEKRERLAAILDRLGPGLTLHVIVDLATGEATESGSVGSKDPVGGFCDGAGMRQVRREVPGLVLDAQRWGG